MQTDPSRPLPWHQAPWPRDIDRIVGLGDTGLVMGVGTVLARMTKGGGLALDQDRERLLALLSVANRGPVSTDVLGAIEVAAGHWQRGDKALANLRLVFSGLPQLAEPVDDWRVRLAEALLDGGLSPRTLMTELGLDASALGKHKYNPDQPRVPAGNGRESGRWKAIWNRIISWLEEPVPEYDTDTGTEVGTRTRGRAIATNPLTILGVGAAALLGSEAIAGATVVADGVPVGTILPNGIVAGVDGVGAAPTLARLGAKFGINADSEVGAHILQNLNMPVRQFISQNRMASILRAFPSEHLDSTVGQALKKGGSTVRKLLLDSRFQK